jgi:predicted dehydrogenase
MGGGALNEQASHYFDALRGWMGEVTSISARIATHDPMRIDPETGDEVRSDADDFVAATLGFASGAIANVSLVWSSRIPAGGELYLTGPGGTISHRSVAGLFAPGEIRLTPARVAGEEPASRRGPVEEGPALPLLEGLEPMEGPTAVVASRRLLRDLERGIAEGVSPSPNFEDGLRTQAMLDAARESSSSGRVVELAADALGESG